MSIIGQELLDTLIDAENAKEQVMLRRIFDRALTFYANPDNLQAFEAWRKNKEELIHAAN